MNITRMRAIEDSQTGIAKKVLASIPTRVPWPVSRIISDLISSGLRPDRHIVEGCIKSLCDSGLVKENPADHFRRLILLPKQTPEHEEHNEMSPAPITVPGAPTDPLTVLSNMASALRTMADKLDELALQIEEKQSAVSEETTKLRQLKNLLKDLS